MDGRASNLARWALAIAVLLGGWFIGDGFARARLGDRFVTVKGVAEREVEADLALWPLAYVATSDHLAQAQAHIEASRRSVLRFLTAQGVDTSAVELQDIQVTDRLANPYGQQESAASRYIIMQRLMVRSPDPARIQAAHQRMSALVDAGVVLGSGMGYGDNAPTFLFTRLNDLKPEMVAEATARARESAEQFAKDSKSALGGIRRASQGVFVILPRDQAPGIQEERQPHKILRVVTTVDYYLKG
jgi:hypothetical protein